MYKQALGNRKLIECIIVSNLVIQRLVLLPGVMELGSQI